jgi:hypothetical protein
MGFLQSVAREEEEYRNSQISGGAEQAKRKSGIRSLRQMVQQNDNGE